ncbi:hypothetical protein GE107_09115 [Cohnella sp. CFH 77786]|uniref:hypothetical protein n=1 Tax=Cohnella sp. CFH 77786 TaxID=2662265 RepID=UPI001C60ACBE|nr:hypothetical protein [Cohnella sp. CFH 77786]MBW5446217.1 hypothetical protein [Cohnella sp. CFH 77786]
MTVNEIQIRRVKFGSFYRFCVLSALSLSVFIAFIVLILSLLGGNVTVNLNGNTYTGITAGLMGLFLCPIIFFLMGSFFSLLLYFPVRLGLIVIKGLRISGEFELDGSNDDVEAGKV